MPCRATQDGWVICQRVLTKRDSQEEGVQTTPVYLPWEPHELYERPKRYDTKDESPRSEGVQYASGEEQRRITNSPRMNEATRPKRIWYPVVDVSGDKSKIQCHEKQYCIGTWNVRFMNQGKLEMVKQEIVRININILGISELKWTGMGKFSSNDRYILLLWARIT